MVTMKRTMTIAAAAALVVAGTACHKDKDGGDSKQDAQQSAARAAQPVDSGAVEVAYDAKEQAPTPAQLAALRRDGAWMQVVQLDSAAPGRPVHFPEKWEQITAQTVNRAPTSLPIRGGDVGGPSVLRVQILLDRSYFSPGIMDGNWGKNTAEALYWFQKSNGLRGTAQVDSATLAKLTQVAGSPKLLVEGHRLTASDVAGPFTKIPSDVYEQAKLPCSCYQSLSEKLSEMFHATPDLLEKLNPGVKLDSLKEGQTVNGPAVRPLNAPSRGTIADIIVSGKGTYVHAVDASGRILYHFPSTLGAQYSPSPSGQFAIAHVTQDPAWHYQPALLTGVPDSLPEAMIPKGPNNAVGVVWMALTAEHYGIHGTGSPETIGYASSHGCIRLTNWDAEFLSHQVRPGIPVHFRDIVGAGGGTAPVNDGSGTTKAGGGAASADAGSSAAGSAGGTSGKSSGTRRGTPSTDSAGKSHRR
jgi:lipoprotein-anchoring transpeptidase ErfK/SrfK